MWNFIFRHRFLGKSVITLTGTSVVYYGCAEVRYGREGLPSEAPTTLSFNAYRLLPLNLLSRGWGWLCSINLQKSLRQPLLGFYARMFNCNLEEAEQPDLNEYSCLSEFFRRALKPDSRPIDKTSPLISPCDGRVLSCGRVVNNEMEQIKGVLYSLNGFLGITKHISKDNSDEREQTTEKLQFQWQHQEETCLHHCVIYLAPGDYHRFHSPTNWDISYRRYFPGYLLSVNPRIALWIRGLFSINERVVYFGKWKHGFFSFAAVGATNVGSINIRHDRNLITNSTEEKFDGDFEEVRYSNQPVHQEKGELFGEFNLGSTVILIFEAPKGFEFAFSPGDRVKMGEGIQKY